MFETIKNAFGTKEIRVKIWATLLLLLVYRIGCFVPVPGISVIDIHKLVEAGSFLSVISAITGGSLSQGTLFALGIIPFINSFIIMQLLTLIIPKLEEMSKDGEEGRKKITQITRYVAIVLGVIQAIGIAFMWKDYIEPIYGMQKNWLAMIYVIVMLVGGSVMVMWLGERITDYGVGNGQSMIIFVGILATAGQAIIAKIVDIPNNSDAIWQLVAFVIVCAVVFFAVVYVDLSERKVPVQYAKQIKGRKMYGGQSSVIPIRISGSGVMPLIFAFSILSFPQMISGLFWPNGGFYKWWTKWMTGSSAIAGGRILYSFVLCLLIFAFSFFYAQMQFNPEDVSKSIQQNGGFIQGIRPGKATENYLKKISNRITLFGAIYLSLVAFIPALAFAWADPTGTLVNVFSTTGILIVVSVAMEFEKQLQAQMMMKNYKGFLK